MVSSDSDIEIIAEFCKNKPKDRKCSSQSNKNRTVPVQTNIQKKPVNVQVASSASAVTSVSQSKGEAKHKHRHRQKASKNGKGDATATATAVKVQTQTSIERNPVRTVQKQSAAKIRTAKINLKALKIKMTSEFYDFNGPVKETIAGINSETPFRKLCKKISNTDSYWIRKSAFVIAEASGQYQMLDLKLLELEAGLRFQSADEVVNALRYLHIHYPESMQLRSSVERVNNMLERQKGSPFVQELMNRVDPQLFVQPMLNGNANDPTAKLKSLIGIANGSTAGFKRVDKQVYEHYLSVRGTLAVDEVSPYDLIWFCLNRSLCDSKLGDLTLDNALSIYHLMVRLCMDDTMGGISGEFFHIMDELGLPRIRPRESWKCCVRLLNEITEKSKKNSKLAEYLRVNAENVSMSEISTFLCDNIDVNSDEEVVRLLLSYAVGMRKSLEGNGNRIVSYPANIFKPSFKIAESCSYARRESAEELEIEKTLGPIGKTYKEVVAVAYNVYRAYQKRNDNAQNEIDQRFRNLLHRLKLTDAFICISHSLMLAGAYSETAEFSSLAIRSLKNEDLQNELFLILLQANVGMRKLKSAYGIIQQFLEDPAKLIEKVENAVGTMPAIKSENDCFVKIPEDCTVHYLALIIMHMFFVSYARHRLDSKPAMPMCLSIVLLSVQALWNICGEAALDDFAEICKRSEISLYNVTPLLLNRRIVLRCLDEEIRFREARSEKLISKNELSTIFSTSSQRKQAFSAFENMFIFLNAHSKEFEPIL